MNDQLVNFAYLVASILFVYGIKMLGSAKTAKKGNLISSVGMLIAVVVTLFNANLDFVWIAAGLILGGVIGFLAAKFVKMTAMPEMVALFNGFGGLASLLVGWAEYEKYRHESGLPEIALVADTTFTFAVIALAVAIGAVTFTGSVQAWGKLSGKLGGGRALVVPGHRWMNLLIVVVIAACGVLFAMGADLNLAPETIYILFIAGMVLALVLGITAVLPIGGGDMPVVIALLNSLSGLAAAAAGFVILNIVLIVAGCLVGCSGLILTMIMCKSMNRTLTNVLFSGFGASSQGSDTVEGEMKASSVEDAYYVLEAASSVVIIPGYGMAVAQAQHAVKELGELLEANGAEVRYAIHPVAGRMPGHMNVLLAEADVPYEQLVEMDDINPIMGTVDVAIVIGANDVVNPAAADDESSPIYGMPIIRAHEARTVFALKRGQGAGFSGLVNKLFFHENTRMLYGDAKSTVTALVTQFKE